MNEQAETTRTCQVCGAETGEDATFCPGCGRRLDIPPPKRREPIDLNALEEEDAPPVGPRRLSGKALLALVLSLLGLLWFPLFPSLFALVLAWMARRDIQADPALRGSGLAIAAMVLGVAGTLLGIAIVTGAIEIREPA